MNFIKIFSLCILVCLFFSSCARMVNKAANKAKYSAWEMVGVEKRDLFKTEIGNVKEEQEESGEAFKDALTRLKEISDFDGGDLEKQHTKLNSSYENAQEEAAEVSASIAKVDQVANDLFVEWEGELKELTTQEYKDKSKKQLNDTKARYKVLHAQLKNSEKKIAPVLAKLKDQVLFLKHNLNAKAIAGLKGETARIQTDIKSLMDEMNQSIKQADDFIKTI
ncbi:MAG TPA: DUF2959 family protein [Bacteriovoracaceae bacterium]|nr:DUF2959 family protein [Bacteriovoracaceae bacterium]